MTTTSTGGYCAVNSIASDTTSHLTMDDSGSSAASRSRTTSEAGSLSSSTSSTAGQQHHQQQQQQRQRMMNHNHHPQHINGGALAMDTLPSAANSSASLSNSRSIFLYTVNTSENVELLLPEETAESVCHRLCKRLRFKPVVELLFGLRNSQDHNFLPGCRPLLPKATYELRLRFKMPDHTKLKTLDKNAFEYFYMQVRHDLIHMQYPGLDYEHNHEKILGLVVADMYLEMIKYNKTADQLCKEYKRFTPKSVQRFAKPKIKDTMRHIVRKDHDQYYVMESYLSQANTIGPFYLREEYDAETDYHRSEEALGSTTLSTVSTNPPTGANMMSPGGGNSSPSFSSSMSSLPSTTSSSREFMPRRPFLPRLPKQTRCALKVELCPEYRKEPVLKVHFKHNDLSRTYKIRGMTFIAIEEGRKLHIGWFDQTHLRLVMASAAAAESFVSGLSTYYRLMDRWTCDLCDRLKSPSLTWLMELRCHGPIGFPAAYEKLQLMDVGYFLVRQCDQFHDTYNLDMKTSPKEVRTFKVTHGSSGPGMPDSWYLHRLETPRTPERFDSLKELAKSIQLAAGAKELVRVGPSWQMGELVSLLLCQKQSETRKVMISGDVEGGPKCIHPEQLLQRKETCRSTEDSAMSEMWGEWTIDNKTFVEVTMKVLKPTNIESNMIAFMNLAQKWCKLQKVPDIMRIYGVTLYNPTAMVMERTRCPLPVLLRDRRPQTKLLIDVTQSLTRALDYLHRQNFVHAKIRCSTLHVAACDGDRLVVRLGDPGINIVFTEADLPWIPVEYHRDGRLKMSKLDLKTDIWAYATTVWQIFSHGRIPPRDCFRTERSFLPKPAECPDKLYLHMRSGWDRDPEKRFEPHALFNTLHVIQQEYEHYYQPMRPSGAAMAASLNQRTISGGSGDSVSLTSTETEQTGLISNGRSTAGLECASVGEFSGSERSLLNYDTCTINTKSTLVGGASVDRLPLTSHMSNILTVLETDEYRVVLQGVLGSGHYGTVLKGEMWCPIDTDESKKVAVKYIKASNSTMNELINEGNMMKRVDHPNIVKILDLNCENEVAIIMEYMHLGNLGSYLSAYRFHMTVPKLLRFTRDIACGMEYLQMRDIVHRDLAVRNVLVAEDETLKISDFGLARDVNNSGYYMVQDGNKDLPIQYYAPETLECSMYSIKSDIWSYGVTLFEIFKKEDEKPVLVEGGVPELMQALREGKRLPKSETCPQAVYDQLMMPCWAYEKARRPTFTLILKAIDNIISEFGEPI